MTISFKVIGQPQSKARPRFANGHIYTPKGTKVYEADVKKAYLAVAQGYYLRWTCFVSYNSISEKGKIK